MRFLYIGLPLHPQYIISFWHKTMVNPPILFYFFKIFSFCNPPIQDGHYIEVLIILYQNYQHKDKNTILLSLETETNSFQEIFLRINRFCKFVVATSRIWHMMLALGQQKIQVTLAHLNMNIVIWLGIWMTYIMLLQTIYIGCKFL